MLEIPVGAHFTPMCELLVGLLACDVLTQSDPISTTNGHASERVGAAGKPRRIHGDAPDGERQHCCAHDVVGQPVTGSPKR